MATDPVCHMMVDERTTKLKADHGGKTYYFCSQGCLDSFSKNPTKYV